MDAILHVSGGSLTAIAGLWFAVGYIVGLFAGAKLGKVTLWPSIVVGVACCILRAVSPPLGVAAIAAVSVLHVGIGCLTVLILKNTQSAS